MWFNSWYKLFLVSIGHLVRISNCSLFVLVCNTVRKRNSFFLYLFQILQLTCSVAAVFGVHDAFAVEVLVLAFRIDCAYWKNVQSSTYLTPFTYTCHLGN